MLFIYSDDDRVSSVRLCRTIVLGFARRGMAGEITNLNIDEDEDGPSKHVEHLRWHRFVFLPSGCLSSALARLPSLDGPPADHDVSYLSVSLRHYSREVLIANN